MTFQTLIAPETVNPESSAKYSRSRPFFAELIAHEPLTKPGSGKDTRHFVLNLQGSGLTYTPGDSLGAFGSNAPGLVDDLIQLLGFDPAESVTGPRGALMPLRQALTTEYIVNRANRKILTGIAERIPQGEQRNELMEIVNNPNLLCEYIDTRDYVDVLLHFNQVRFESAAAFISQLTPSTPRLYSIASSQAVYPNEVHLCVAVVRYDTHGRSKKGLASGFLADHADMFVRSIPVYVQPSRTFRLPQDSSRDIIMVGPGAGVAPFRAFIQQRIADGATGRNWLFFGEQRRATDFLYGEEWQRYQIDGKLHRLDLAFSRDQAEKIYVQHRLREQAVEVWRWLQEGAYFYVCGDAKHMARDVHQTLIEIAQRQGGMSADAAAEYVNVTLMKTEKRYLRDIY